jgi:hypothetical protein
MSARTITLLIAVLSTIATGLAAAGQVVSPETALLFAACGAGLYGIVRTLQKVKAGTPVSKLLRSTEILGAGFASVASIITAAVGVVPPEYAAKMIGLAGIITAIARVVQSQMAAVIEAPAPPDPPKP